MPKKKRKFGPKERINAKREKLGLEPLPVDEGQPVEGGTKAFEGSVEFHGRTHQTFVRWRRKETVISNGEITFQATFMVIDTEGSSAADTLTTVQGGADGDLLILASKNSARDITVEDNTGNLQMAGNFTLSHPSDRIMFQYDSAFAVTPWIELSRSDNFA